MKNLSRFLALAALVLLPLTLSRAQGTYTSGAIGGPINPDLTFNSAIQTFSGFSSLSAVTWTVNNSSGSAQTASFNLYYAQWNAGSGVISSPLTAFGSTSGTLIGGSSSGDLTFSVPGSVSLTPAQTYVLVLSNTNLLAFNAASGGTPGAPDSTFFGTGGIASVAATDVVGNLSTALSSPTTISSAYAYQMSVTGVAGAPTPVPEPKTAAASVAALFVAALVGRRLWQRRKAATAPLAA